jgi:RNA-directed DNA polymerase
MQSIQRFLEKKLTLKINQEKSSVGPTDHLEYVGFVFKKPTSRWSEKAFQEFKRRIKTLTGRSWGVSMRYRLETLALYIRGWMNDFGISEYDTPIPELDY